MLTLKLITEETDRVINGLKKKHFDKAEEAIQQVLDINKRRKEAQQQLDSNLAEVKKLSAQIGSLMKTGQKEKAEKVKQTVAALKESSKTAEADMQI